MNLRWIYFLLIVSLASCKKDKLTKEYSAFKGVYEWSATPLDDKNIFSNTSYSLTSSITGYTVSFELNDKGEAIFYKNGSQLSKNKYTILEKESYSPGNAKIIIKLKEKTGDMVISNNTLMLRLSNNNLLEIDYFPFPAIDNIENYKPGYGQKANQFLRK